MGPAKRAAKSWGGAPRGVLAHPGYFFDLDGAGAHLVVSLLPKQQDFDAGIEQLLASVAR